MAVKLEILEVKFPFGWFQIDNLGHFKDIIIIGSIAEIKLKILNIHAPLIIHE